MKITTRIISGYGLLLAVVAGLVVYQSITIRRMEDINKALSGINFRNTRAYLEVWRSRIPVDEYTKKSLASTDPEYVKKLREFQIEFEKSLKEAESYANPGEEAAGVKRLRQLWDSYTVGLASLQQNPPESRSVLQESLQNDLAQMDTQIDSVLDASKRSMRSQLTESSNTQERAARVLLSATFVALAISILVSYLIFRSISKPLASLTEGTRAIAEGKFFYRLDASRNDEFSQLAKDFNTMTHRLNELDELKKDFVSHVSHELKAPLASIRETIQLLLDQIPGPLTEKQKRLLDLNLQSGVRLTSMISNLLDLSKTEAGMMEYELKSQDLLPLVRNAVAEFEVQAQERQIKIRTAFPEVSLPVKCDSDRIVQVILNLVGNAVKFSPRTGSIQVKVEAIPGIPESMPNHWRPRVSSSDHGRYFGLVTVSDSGPGIPDSEKETIFEKFRQVKQGKRIAGQGVGLGLAICLTIVEAHGGAIWVEDNPGGGSRFQLLLRPGEKAVGSE